MLQLNGTVFGHLRLKYMLTDWPLRSGISWFSLVKYRNYALN
jgi:hypothetical protein